VRRIISATIIYYWFCCGLLVGIGDSGMPWLMKWLGLGALFAFSYVLNHRLIDLEGTVVTLAPRKAFRALAVLIVVILAIAISPLSRVVMPGGWGNISLLLLAGSLFLVSDNGRRVLFLFSLIAVNAYLIGAEKINILRGAVDVVLG